jgi:pimeloyl-ACP methyl ester carboxylesterase
MQIVFVHGSGGCGAVWQHQTDFFRGSDAVDLPGHPDGELLPSVDAYVDWLKAYIDGKAYGKVVIVGHSIGGAIAMLYALNHPEDLAAIVLVGSGARLRVLPQILQELEKAIDDPALFVQMLRGTWEKVDPDVGEPLMARFEDIGPAAFLNDLRACDRFDIIDRLSEITTPTLAVCGTDDVMTPPKYSHFLTDGIAGARAEIIQGGTHMVFLEKPDQVNRAIEAFLDGR